MFSESAELYDLIYSTFKNFEAESDKVAALLTTARPGLETVLDVACGTGEHARLLTERHGLRVDGIDLDPNFVRIAQGKNRQGQFTIGDMSDFDLGRRYDAVICLFSSIGYVRTLDRVTKTLACFRDHLAPGGVVIVEPWLAPDAVRHGYLSSNIAERGALRVERRSHIEVDGRVSWIHFDYDIVDDGRVSHASEVHELGLFTTEEMQAAFASAGLDVEYDPKGLIGRGLYVAHRAGEPAA